MKKLIVAITVMMFGFSAFAQNTGNLLNNYISVKNALVSSDSKAANTAISALNEAVKSEDNFAQKAELQKATEKLSKAGNNIEKQRAAFNDVSTIMWKLVKPSDKVNQPVYYQYCPMKKAYWLSKEKDIKNPYYGSSMLTCGKVAETK
ncbi:MAG: hypothetical protein CMO82_00830 [Winogradskyella sp.]|jgi:hypothetical protein|uniref:DUF3347 domain-containing protein n=3 Tax=Bacteroidota TaxID=976 RepID=A0A419S309_9SPHI|nr:MULTISPECIES: DUF3347 domain-containing protein [Bacteroidota]MBC72248.1 hypothetical protein [Allomuricauda sp.]MBL85189.1 hypothetical protein [Winogradskyella sp.]RPG28016.1 MAG: DUF3347 domain-containing protein [Muricauda sp. TMED12]UBZ13123.1 DUF3347 domain-containing protein [Allomuricauda aquimarina]GMN08075.1 hypothetical protein MTsPCn5_34640 [Croceitalea sp. MTPC5]GMN10593.1 hypothetical protein MTsPCn6_19220 [Croceitalea sp. MTPC6]GMN17494.1 hypothetical protein MTsPCn9_24320 |tara:strand:+ start:53 stop:496 length:444 start_codon:yes stop_codon:yes gene_type:complete